jgi:hypothetical protein
MNIFRTKYYYFPSVLMGIVFFCSQSFAQELQFMKENGNRQLTENQITQLFRQLNSLDSSI